MSNIKRYTVKIRYVTEFFQEMNPYAADENQAKEIALKMFHDTTRGSENKYPEVVEIKEFKLTK